MWLFVRQASVINIEVGVKYCMALGAQKYRLGLDPLCRFHFLGICHQARVELGDELWVLIGEVVLLIGVRGEIVELCLAGERSHSHKLPVALANGASDRLEMDKKFLVRTGLSFCQRGPDVGAVKRTIRASMAAREGEQGRHDVHHLNWLSDDLRHNFAC